MDNGAPDYATYDARIAELKGRVGLMQDRVDHLLYLAEHAQTLVAKSKALVDLLDDVERNQGGLLSVQALRGRDELRLELSKWPE